MNESLEVQSRDQMHKHGITRLTRPDERAADREREVDGHQEPGGKFAGVQ
jgi:hypothetical protein